MIIYTEDVFVELCKRYKLDPMKDIVRHHDVTRKNCPAPWVKNGQAFEDFKKRVKLKMSDGNVYIVQKGDTLSKIAKQHNTTVGELQKLNGISNPDMIRIGQKLRVK